MRYGRRNEGEDARVRTRRLVSNYFQAQPLTKAVIEQLIADGVHVLINYRPEIRPTDELPIIWWNDPDALPLSASVNGMLDHLEPSELPRHFYLLRQIVIIIARRYFDPTQRGLIEPGLKAACFDYADNLWRIGDLPIDEVTLSRLLRQEARLLPDEGHNNLSLT